MISGSGVQASGFKRTAVVRQGSKAARRLAYARRGYRAGPFGAHPVDLPCPRATKEGHPSKKAEDFVSLQEVQALAHDSGLSITVKDLGPFYRIVCREGNEEGRILALTTGFVAPLFGLMHCDTLQVFTRGMKGSEGERVRGGVLGLGLLVGGATFSYGYSCGCKKAEILAINDDDAWHARLVKYYSYFGFKPVAIVGGNSPLSDIPHMLVWGGVGTRMDADIPGMLAKWTPAFRSKRERLREGEHLAASE
uniref:Uncharacterized protein n=2 Tax=Dunaliella tertiolecta TaxID=3047 RepID=A0A7S3QNX9_DUNTE|mmetsp:Transcript_22376/g.61830  ORF Transcript_22376/g.61830 Transcript_22376/m.61830 type:complete len:251 (+) Transcript_22376:136-888(+)|eukprot:CAMPEP_0202421496 /NCGR_PEP_ID=MMETSP1128-20130828/50368_1 /ASSEMBLY_ACC=CAM_ASM_000463 /TAXON_ID=3047 /ORGANISM="Dunaliella tertiolecta, Strain CCMP1320" /LENGTH=250 /DNA_ID=CAMNT_0049029519 /DNA_START=37 /DNA_END=789 /DNA_ORIENTATION=-